ncbi:MAG: hypothetical protein AAF607_03825 [Pseudomonadota bacterium]
MTLKYTQADMDAAIETGRVNGREQEYNAFIDYAETLTAEGIPPVGILMGLTLKKHRNQTDNG